MPDRGFIQQKKLIELRLSNNKIFRVTNSTFDGLKTVTILSLRKNFLEELSSRVFSSLTSVEELDLGQNRIKSVEEATFSGLAHLRVLYLDDNDLQQVPTPALTPLPHLAELNLALNNIKEHCPPHSAEIFLHKTQILSFDKLFSPLLACHTSRPSWLTILHCRVYPTTPSPPSSPSTRWTSRATPSSTSPGWPSLGCRVCGSCPWQPTAWPRLK